MRTTHLFCYGTLRAQGGAGNAIKGLRGMFVGTAYLDGYEMCERNWIPYVLPGTGTITGDLVSFHESDIAAALRYLDTYEGYHPNREAHCNYWRRGVKVQAADNGDIVDAWCYVSNPNLVRPSQDFGFTKIPDGDYVKYTSPWRES
jgi:gamma-glutamylcyclotransferase (GGCT)/AIG2-like uncharacterized protein YtfP